MVLKRVKGFVESLGTNPVKCLYQLLFFSFVPKETRDTGLMTGMHSRDSVGIDYFYPNNSRTACRASLVSE